MPPAVAITMPSARVSPALPAHGLAAETASASTTDFGKLFRENAGAAQVSVPPVAASLSMSGEANVAATRPVTHPEKQAAANAGQPSAGSFLREAASSLPGAAYLNPSPAVVPAQLQGGNASRIPTSGASHPDSPAELSPAATSESETAPVIESQSASRKLSPSAQTGHAHKARSSAEAAEKISVPNTPKETVVSFSTPSQFTVPPTVIPPVQPAASSVPEPVPAVLNKVQTANAALAQRGFAAGLTGDPQSPSASHDTIPPCGTSQSIAGNHAEPPASNPQTVGQRPVAGSVESAAPPKEMLQASSTGSHSAILPHTGAAQAGEPAAAIANTATPAAPAPMRYGDAPGPALPRPDSPAASATSATAPAAPSSPNLYDRIDQGSAPALLHSGAQQVAVGIRDPALGWVEIKTQNLAGHVDATLVTTSGQTHATLAAQLPAISDFLQQRDVRLGALSVHHQAPGANTGSGQSGSTGDGPGAQNPSQSGSGNPQRSGDTPGYAPAARAAPAATAALWPDGAAFRPVSYISVRA